MVGKSELTMPLLFGFELAANDISSPPSIPLVCLVKPFFNFLKRKINFSLIKLSYLNSDK
jgi:hypothetical protein